MIKPSYLWFWTLPWHFSSCVVSVKLNRNSAASSRLQGEEGPSFIFITHKLSSVAQPTPGYVSYQSPLQTQAISEMKSKLSSVLTVYKLLNCRYIFFSDPFCFRSSKVMFSTVTSEYLLKVTPPFMRQHFHFFSCLLACKATRVKF